MTPNYRFHVWAPSHDREEVRSWAHAYALDLLRGPDGDARHLPTTLDHWVFAGDEEPDQDDTAETLGTALIVVQWMHGTAFAAAHWAWAMPVLLGAASRAGAAIGRVDDYLDHLPTPLIPAPGRGTHFDPEQRAFLAVRAALAELEPTK